MSDKTDELTKDEINKLIEPNFDVDTEISSYLEGYNDLKYVYKVETHYDKNYASVIRLNDKNDLVVDHINYKPYLYIKDLSRLGIKLFDNDNDRIKTCSKFQLKFKKLRYSSKDGIVNQRLYDGYTYMVETTKSFKNLMDFFRFKNLNPYGEHKHLFHIPNILSQFYIQTGIRAFKGIDDYEDLHSLTFDIETTGLDFKENNERIFLIGVKDNRSLCKILSADRNDFSSESELNIIIEFFEILYNFKPAVLRGYNIYNFDLPFIVHRFEVLSQEVLYNSNDVPQSLINRINLVKDFIFKWTLKNASLKVGAETEYFDRTDVWGINIIDTYQAVRRVKAINSDIRETNLKYITKYLMNDKVIVEKKDRTYVKGDKIFNMWKENKRYVIDKNTNAYTHLEEDKDDLILYKDYYTQLISDVYKSQDRFFSDGFNADEIDLAIIDGSAIIEQYLYDDLWESEQVDYAYTTDSFMLCKFLPVNLDKKVTMGNSAMWTNLMECASYFSDLAIPEKPEKEDFTGGLSRLFKIGYNENIQKLDYASLYPSLKLTFNMFPKCDVDNLSFRFLSFFMLMRTHYKNLAKVKSLPAKMRKNFKIRQLPFKIFNNSEFGATGSAYYPWGELDVAEFTTASGRQYLRALVKYFHDYGCDPLVLDTDGVNFSMPKNYYRDAYGNTLTIPITLEEQEYTNKSNKQFKGLSALIESFNEKILFGDWMNLSDDGIWVSAINFSKKNYTNLEEDGSVKYVGNTIKSSNTPKYIEEFLNRSISYILNGNPELFVEDYYETVHKIWNYDIPLIKIASKAKVKSTIDNYLIRGNNINGKKKNKQVHMELVIQNKLNVNIGDTIYYINNGSTKSTSDVKVDKKTNKLVSYLIDTNEIERNKDLKGVYNREKYLDSFNNKAKILLVCFGETVRNKLIIKPIKEKTSNGSVIVLQPRSFFTKEELQLKSFNKEELGNESDLNISKTKENEDYVDDLYDDLFTMEQKEVEFWLRFKDSPDKYFADYISPIKDEKFYLISENKRISTLSSDNESIDYFLTNNFENKHLFFETVMIQQFTIENNQLKLIKTNLDFVNDQKVESIKNEFKKELREVIKTITTTKPKSYVQSINKNTYVVCDGLSNIFKIIEKRNNVNFIKGEWINKSLKKGVYMNDLDTKWVYISKIYEKLESLFKTKGLNVFTEYNNLDTIKDNDYVIKGGINDFFLYQYKNKTLNKIKKLV